MDEADRNILMQVAGVVSRPARHERKQLTKTLRRRDRAQRRAHDAELIAVALNRSARRSSTFVLPASTANPDHVPPPASERELLEPRACYICKADYRRVHSFYDSMCPECAALNWQKRFQTARLDGRVALITGARIKIGYQAALMLLRAGARVIATTRFPNEAALRYAREPDFAEWRDRLELHGIDLRNAPAVERFCARLSKRGGRLDFLINNAAQTVRRPPAFYQHLLAIEERPRLELPSEVQRLLSADEAEAPGENARAALVAVAPDDLAYARELFPAGQLDLDEQQVDLRAVNSWRLQLAEVSTAEMLEVHLVNAVAPFVLTSRLKPLMMRDRTDQKHVVQVSAMEAQFARNKKTDKHPHTNMAKAALNMMTRTSAADYVQHGIFMNSVDTCTTCF
jgi:NAD(P)-dependent dehydrogenase (short-subunit alcohol dehydrogenase family)